MAKTCQNCRITSPTIPPSLSPHSTWRKRWESQPPTGTKTRPNWHGRPSGALEKKVLKKLLLFRFGGFFGGGSWRDGVFFLNAILKKNMPIFGSWRQTKKCVRFLSLSLKLLVLDIVLDLGQFDIILSDKFECFATAFGTFPKFLKHTFAPTFWWMFFFLRASYISIQHAGGTICCKMVRQIWQIWQSVFAWPPEAICWDSWHWRNTTNQHRSEVWSSPTSLPVTRLEVGCFCKCYIEA